MNGKWIALILAASLSCGGCKKTPTATGRSATLPPSAAAKSQPDDIATRIRRLVAAYEWEPTPDRAAAAWSGFESLDSKLHELRRIVATQVGGTRAEAEIQRIELQRLREATMARFSNTHARQKISRPVQDTLTAALDGEGMRAAAAAITRYAGSEGRLSGREMSIVSRLQTQMP